MEYINIISKEAITTIPEWQVHTILWITIGIVVIPSIYSIVAKDFNKALSLVVLTGVGAICFEVISLCACSAFFRQPTGRYKYEGIIDKNKITVSQYEEFIEKYNPIIQDEIYYWED